MRVLSIQIGRPERVPDAREKAGWYRTAYFKAVVAGPVRLLALGLEGDGQADKRYHGGPDKAVNAYASEHYTRWADLLDEPVRSHGAFGENFTLSGLTEDTVCIGDAYSIGDAVIQVSQPRGPCWKMGRAWGSDEFPGIVQDSGLTGWYFRVLTEGTVEAGMPLTLLERPLPEWTVAAANEVMYHLKTDREAARALAECAELAEAWREPLRKRAGKPG